jgi:hypothetical protein
MVGVADFGGFGFSLRLLLTAVSRGKSTGQVKAPGKTGREWGM